MPRLVLALYVGVIVALLLVQTGRGATPRWPLRCEPQVLRVYVDGPGVSRSYDLVRWPRGCRVPS